MPATRSLPSSRAQKARCRAGPGLWDVNVQMRKALSQEKAGARARSVFHGLPAPNTSFCTLVLGLGLIFHLFVPFFVYLQVSVTSNTCLVPC